MKSVNAKTVWIHSDRKYGHHSKTCCYTIFNIIVKYSLWTRSCSASMSPFTRGYRRAQAGKWGSCPTSFLMTFVQLLGETWKILLACSTLTQNYTMQNISNRKTLGTRYQRKMNGGFHSWESFWIREESFTAVRKIPAILMN